jgi:hypothetical protein
MIAQQEELDWEVYASYGLLDEAIVYDGEPPEVRLGERAFEIVLARRRGGHRLVLPARVHPDHRDPRPLADRLP